MRNDPSFSKEFDDLFKKIKLRIFVSQKVKIIFIVGVLLLSGILLVSLVLLPKKIEDSLSKFDSVFDTYNSQMKELNDSLDYKDILALREKGIKTDYKPDYKTAKVYTTEVTNNTINFGNGYSLKVNNSNHSLEKDFSKELEIKAIEGVTHKYQVASVDTLATYKFQLTKYLDDYDQATQKLTFYQDTAYKYDNYVSVYISGNIIDNLNLQVMKEDSAFYEVFPMPKIGQVQTGLIVNTALSHNVLDETGKEIPKTFVTFYKYWIFPDGVGFYVQQSNHFYGTLTYEEDSQNSVKDNLNELDKFSQIFDGTQSMLNWINHTFELEVNKE
ncbi:hypothetical protein CKN73_06555 [Carnobacterium divergens]|uniref:hypothetical protein n=1 Tax=Carnobacterium divergens TaxID=2748 RepID=UPI001072ACD6|nr:hypothetical protein [Carnobacterium divergens]TFJ40656.1 hypothetical protein CKN77_06680 [Carnobacterium divergens]TFJ49344.1 hypothetical protein CKN73_06555 [Carnobacterium divergens]TFJ54711.1 hypothetical protein CKN83_06485 [Carnobacterium divergens]TFJ60922.1 hypothetical protein CKN89_06865 [Carnobacterium divergens]TFJ71062.1 hypothetical protein CKN91_06490 [Carnobacterium divergens]